CARGILQYVDWSFNRFDVW
nr:immunoglobulin heavy chain junction region [Macaca mulatta]